MLRCCILAILAVVSAPLMAAELTTLSGKRFSGDLLAIDNRAVKIRTADGELMTPINDVLLIDIGPENSNRDKYTEVELADGSVLACSNVELKVDRAVLTLASGQVLEAPLNAVRTMLREAHEVDVRKEWTQILRKRGALDLLVLRSEGKLDALEGTFGSGTGDGIEFVLSANDQKLTPKLSRLQGLIFVRKPDPNAVAPICKLVDTAGNVIVSKSVAIDGDDVKVESVAGGITTYPSLKRIARLDFSKGKLTYLSDLEPIEKEETSTEDLIFPYRKDRNLYGGPLRIKNTHYSKGLAIHSRSVLTYDLGGDYQLFRAVLGVDDVVRYENGVAVRVNVVIEADGRELYRGEVTSSDEPKPLALDVKNVRKLRITVAAPLLDLGQQVNLGDARVSK
jgi:hypothetical protein